MTSIAISRKSSEVSDFECEFFDAMTGIDSSSSASPSPTPEKDREELESRSSLAHGIFQSTSGGTF